MSSNDMKVSDLIKLISNENGIIYPLSYSANMMAAHGIDERLVAYFHDAAAQQNRASTDRSMILSDYRNRVPYGQAAADSFLRWNSHLLEGLVEGRAS